MSVHSVGKFEETLANSNRGWLAELELRFEHAQQRSFLAFKRHCGPLRVQRPFYPEGADKACHVYLLHPPGGVVGGDELHININAEKNAHAVVTTPAAGKFYRSAGPFSFQTQELVLDEKAIVEWLPQENIVFSGARANMCTRVQLASQSRFIGWEITCLGSAPTNELFTTGNFNTRFEVWRGKHPIFIECSAIEGGGDILTSRWGMAGFTVMGSLFCEGSYPGLVEKVREHVCRVSEVNEDYFFTVTQLEGGLVC